MGWFLGNIGKEIAHTRLNSELTLGLSGTSSLLNQTFSKPLILARLTTKNERVKEIIRSPKNPEGIEKVIQLLDRYKEESGAHRMAVFSEEGILIASDKEIVRHLGKDLSFRPYVRKSLKGKESHYFAYGAVDKIRGYYASVPVFDDLDNVIGVAMAKYKLDEPALNIDKYEHMYLVSPEGIILLSSNSGWLFKSLYPIDQKRRNQLKQSRQFGDNPIEQLNLNWDTKRQEVSFNDSTFLFKEFPVTDDGWKLVMFVQDTLTAEYQWMLAALSFCLFVITVGCMLFIFKKKQTEIVLEQYNLNLERMVLERTKDLEEAHKQLQQSEKLFKATFEQVAVGMAHVAPDGKWLRVNQRLCDIVGYTHNEMLSLTFQDITYPEDLDVDLRHVAHLLSGESNTYSMEKRYFHKDGSIVWINLTVSLVRDESGRPKHFISVIEDITERKQAEGELVRLRLYLKDMLDSMPSVLVGVDKEGHVTHWNQEAERLTGLSADDAKSQPLMSVLPQLKSQMEQIKTAMSRKEPHLEQKVSRQENGETHYSDIMVYPLISNGVEGAVVRVDDVTDRVRIEQMMIQTEKMMSVGGLAAGMAHEINNPLGAIMQGVQNAIRRLSPDLEANQKAAEECGADLETVRSYLEKRGILRYLDGMREAGTRAAKIVSNMLDFSRRSESKLAPTEINNLMDSVLELADSDYDLLKKYDFRHVKVERDYGADLSQIPCTPTEIEQVFLNLIRNAAEAMAEVREKDAEPRITIRTQREKDHALIEVTDNGPGMDEETRKRVFEPFFTTKPVGEGTGLGLSVSYFIITNNHNGTMSVESEPGKGTTFIIRLPLERKGS